ncbi:hypothetical protein L2E82_38464 [Cichorium intybus]|uniref:Uncharacterized protein n=1 Tax=Cichorium intybus TaxID=13427 RepID=A0ACB9AG26_CICIN|nr:hypothetical protein L2E82_38464 [Cichorium intybus]
MRLRGLKHRLVALTHGNLPCDLGSFIVVEGGAITGRASPSRRRQTLEPLRSVLIAIVSPSHCVRAVMDRAVMDDHIDLSGDEEEGQCNRILRSFASKL